MKIAVNDANIFIDLIDIGLVRRFFRLKLDFHTTTLVINELDENQKSELQPFIAKGTLKVKAFSTEEMEAVEQMELDSQKLSQHDLSVYYYAKTINAVILTGDKSLRTEAKKHGFEVHGVLWIFEQLIANNVITYGVAIDKLNDLMKINTWLPVQECFDRIEKWKKHL